MNRVSVVEIISVMQKIIGSSGTLYVLDPKLNQIHI